MAAKALRRRKAQINCHTRQNPAYRSGRAIKNAPDPAWDRERFYVCDHSASVDSSAAVVPDSSDGLVRVQRSPLSNVYTIADDAS